MILFGIIFSNIKNQVQNNVSLLVSQKKQVSNRKKDLMDTLLTYSSTYVMRNETEITNYVILEYHLEKLLEKRIFTNSHISKNFPKFIANYIVPKTAKYQDSQKDSIDENNPVNFLKNSRYKKMITSLLSREKTINNLELVLKFLNVLTEDNEKEIFSTIVENEIISKDVASSLRKIREGFSPKNFQNHWLPILKKITALPWKLIHDILLTVGVPFYDSSFFSDENEKNLFEKSQIFRWIQFAKTFLNYDLEMDEISLKNEKGEQQNFTFAEILNWVEKKQNEETILKKSKISFIPNAPQMIKEQVVAQIMQRAGEEIVTNFVHAAIIDEKGKFNLPTNWWNWLEKNQNQTEAWRSFFNFIKLFLFIEINKNDKKLTPEKNFSFKRYFAKLLKVLKIDLHSSEMGYFREGVQKGLEKERKNSNPLIWRWVASNTDKNIIFYLTELLTFESDNLKKNYIKENLLNSLSEIIKIFPINLNGIKNLLFHQKQIWDDFQLRWIEFKQKLNELETISTLIVKNKNKLTVDYYEKFDEFLEALFMLNDLVVKKIIPSTVEGIGTNPLMIFYLVKKILTSNNYVNEDYFQNDFDIVYGLIYRLTFGDVNSLLGVFSDVAKDAKAVFIAFLKTTINKDGISNKKLLNLFFSKLTADLDDLDSVHSTDNLKIHANSLFRNLYKKILIFSNEKLEKKLKATEPLVWYLLIILKSDDDFLTFLKNKIENEIEEKFLFYLKPENWSYENLNLDQELINVQSSGKTNKKHQVSFTAFLRKEGYKVFAYNFVWEVDLKIGRAKLLSWERLNLTNNN